MREREHYHYYYYYLHHLLNVFTHISFPLPVLRNHFSYPNFLILILILILLSLRTCRFSDKPHLTRGSINLYSDAGIKLEELGCNKLWSFAWRPSSYYRCVDEEEEEGESGGGGDAAAEVDDDSTSVFSFDSRSSGGGGGGGGNNPVAIAARAERYEREKALKEAFSEMLRRLEPHTHTPN